ncbi:hypothetical protein GOP47_0004159 [Adiantum capillus-veneris]|uniref:Uncharacterized protein n=1 Tax=Adiantum capillus-veneris TaxID=13818 RepID=A0A9D4V857_ADICA|nr:hypothetical protein GOP47_0004159 [Adiantum capillus-veneris]
MWRSLLVWAKDQAPSHCRGVLMLQQGKSMPSDWESDSSNGHSNIDLYRFHDGGGLANRLGLPTCKGDFSCCLQMGIGFICHLF